MSSFLPCRRPARSARARVALLLPVLLLAAPVAAQESEPTSAAPLALEAYLDWEWVADPQISPDGRRVVYTRRWVDKVEDRPTSSLWIMEADGSRNRHLVDGAAATWSPDGTRIAYVSPGRPSGSQIFVRWMDAEGATSQVTRLENGPSEVRWSPDGAWLAFTSRVDERAEFAGIDLPDRPRGARWTGEPKVVERAAYRRDRQGYVDTGWTHVFVVPAEGGTARQLTDGSWNHSGVAWSPDGTELYFTANRREDHERPEAWQESDIYAVTLADGQIRRLTGRAGPDGGPVPSPDGSLIAYTGQDQHDDTYRNRQILVMGRDGSDPRVISGGFDRQASGLTWASDGSGLFFNVRREGYANVHFVALDGGVRQITRGKHLLSFASVSVAPTTGTKAVRILRCEGSSPTARACERSRSV